VAKVEWHPGELYPRVGFIVTNMTRPAERVVPFYNQRDTAEGRQEDRAQADHGLAFPRELRESRPLPHR
jgi:hypothetical protein